MKSEELYAITFSVGILAVIIVYFIKGVVERRRVFVCTTCHNAGRSKIQTPGSTWITLILIFPFFIPAIVYEVWRMTSKKKICKSCDSSNIVPISSPVGQKIIGQVSSGE